jgi:hypothetical protein
LIFSDLFGSSAGPCAPLILNGPSPALPLQPDPLFLEAPSLHLELLLLILHRPIPLVLCPHRAGNTSDDGARPGASPAADNAAYECASQGASQQTRPGAGMTNSVASMTNTKTITVKIVFFIFSPFKSFHLKLTRRSSFHCCFSRVPSGLVTLKRPSALPSIQWPSQTSPPAPVNVPGPWALSSLDCPL